MVGLLDPLKGNKKQSLGAMFFSHPTCRTGMICHESLHAALCVGRCLFMDFSALDARTKNNDNEELLAVCSGYIAKQVVELLAKIKERV